MYFLIVLRTVFNIRVHVSSQCPSLFFYKALITVSSSKFIFFFGAPGFFLSPDVVYGTLEKLGVGSPISYGTCVTSLVCPPFY
jgi:hypothetical protein